METPESSIFTIQQDDIYNFGSIEKNSLEMP